MNIHGRSFCRCIEISHLLHKARVFPCSAHQGDEGRNCWLSWKRWNIFRHNICSNSLSFGFRLEIRRLQKSSNAFMRIVKFTLSFVPGVARKSGCCLGHADEIVEHALIDFFTAFLDNMPPLLRVFPSTAIVVVFFI